MHFAIPNKFEESVQEVQHLRHCYDAFSSFSRQERAEAQLTGEELLENDIIRQIRVQSPDHTKSLESI
jgi:hypothetical protein